MLRIGGFVWFEIPQALLSRIQHHFEFFFIFESHDLLQYLAILKQQHRGNRADRILQ